MPATGSPSRRPTSLDAGWVLLSAVCVAAMVAWPSWETIPFHVIWISLTLLYGFRVWSLPTTGLALGAVIVATGASIMADAFAGIQLWGELFEVPLMSAMFLAMVWHARRRAQALSVVGALADERARLLEQEERLLLNVSHELRTPVTITRGHLELLQRRVGDQPELDVAFDELARVESIVERVLMLARVEQPGLIAAGQVPLVPFLEDVFMRWAGVAQRAWRLGAIVDVTVTADESLLRAALDALLENAVQHTEEYARIEVSAHAEDNTVAISVADDGPGVPAGAAERIFERFARSDASRTRREGGAGLGLAIVTAIARAHGGSARVRSDSGRGAVFELLLPLEQAAHADTEEPAGPLPGAREGVAAVSA